MLFFYYCSIYIELLFENELWCRQKNFEFVSILDTGGPRFSELARSDIF